MGRRVSTTRIECPDEQSPLLRAVANLHHGPICHRPPCVSATGKFLEAVRMITTHLRVLCCKSQHHSSMSASFEPLSETGRFVKLYVEPMFHWWGANFRLLTTPCLGTVEVVNAAGKRQCVVNGASHNYAGFYAPTTESEELQRLCLELLPVSDSDAVPLLRDAVHAAIAGFFDSDFCFTTSTGYGANYVALPALIEPTRTVVVVDRVCHNSIFTGVYLGRCSAIHKFNHNDMFDLESTLKNLPRNSDQDVIVIVEGLYSMDGDVPPLGALWRLKSEYGFVLYCDEAHSFLSIGSTGLGCLQYWNETHQADPVPWDLIDIRTGTLSKAIGGIGGFISGKSFLEERVQRHIKKVQDRDHISIPTSTMVQTLLVMDQPQRISRNLNRLAAISRFCRTELDRYGVYVYGDETGTPILPVWAGRPSASARLSFALRQAGLLASPVTAPAVPFWESRVRVNLSADYSDADVNSLVNSIVSAVVSIGLCKRRPETFRVNKFQELQKTELEESEESRISSMKIKGLINLVSIHLRNDCHSRTTPVGVDSARNGHSARSMYGIGAGSARWISGTFPPHLAVERLLARAHGAETAMTYADATIGLASTIAALARPVFGITILLYDASKFVNVQHMYTDISVSDSGIVALAINEKPDP
ncbi:Aminotransferase FUM8 [Diaporthe amygdali]|uniref:Aminotransferase FUM8 n=1 Tax=Phomopsis amygdali TaxID=1214568 RepID=UPI0022FE1B17|nr:Aminotransferase FUM8 [Diaporthe amygdali]KAJ0122921.1 Aminotransferase FUM8 [Diaporthe amygdali]